MPAQSAAARPSPSASVLPWSEWRRSSGPITGNWAECGVDDRLVEVAVPAKDEAEHGREDEQEREDREEGVVGDRGREVAALIVGVLQQHREREAEPAMPLLEAVEGAVALAESAHVALLRLSLANVIL
jgi:hypothetical protein